LLLAVAALMVHLIKMVCMEVVLLEEVQRKDTVLVAAAEHKQLAVLAVVEIVGHLVKVAKDYIGVVVTVVLVEAAGMAAEVLIQMAVEMMTEVAVVALALYIAGKQIL
jgi:hypothetical protein